MAYEVQSKPKQSISQVLASNGAKSLATNLQLNAKQIMKANSAALSLSTNPILKNCDPYSILKYVYEVARYDFSRDDCVYPVPYGNSIQAQIGYKGFRELALKSGVYEDVNATVVYSCDKILRDRQTGAVKVEFEEDYNKTLNAKIVGFYAYAVKKGTHEVCNSLYWSKEKCEEHGKTFSKTYNSLWGKNEFSFNKMALKTVLKQLTNELQTTPLLEDAKKQDGYIYNEGYIDNPLNSNKNKVMRDIDNALSLEYEEKTTEEEAEELNKKIVEVNDMEEVIE